MPSWDLKTLWVNDDLGNTLTPIDPRTGTPGAPVPVHDPYNLYFTPDGKSAIVMAERRPRRSCSATRTRWRSADPLPCPASGVNHADFSADGRYFLRQLRVRRRAAQGRHRATPASWRACAARPGAMPQDVKLAPDGSTFYVADMATNGVWILDGDRVPTIARFLPTGQGAHGLYVSRDSPLPVHHQPRRGLDLRARRAHRHAGRQVAHPRRRQPRHGRGLAPTARCSGCRALQRVVYAISTTDGQLLAKIPVGAGPHGLCVYPQPGRYSLGHTGIFR